MSYDIKITINGHFSLFKVLHTTYRFQQMMKALLSTVVAIRHCNYRSHWECYPNGSRWVPAMDCLAAMNSVDVTSIVYVLISEARK